MIEWIGWTLVHAAWQAGLIAAAVALALWVTRRGGAPLRYIIAVVGLAFMVAAPIGTTIATRPAARGAITIERVTTVMLSSAGATAPEIQSENATSPSLSRRVGAEIDAALPWLVVVWLFGVAMFSMRMASGVTQIWRLRRGGSPAVDARIRAATDQLAERLGIRSAVRVLQSTQIDVPMVVGWLKPVVLVPGSLLAGVTTVQLEMLLAHELAHIRRHDTIVSLAQAIIETLLFFHPAVWWLSARAREERENCCDDLALAISGGDRSAYGSLLLLLEESRSSTALALAANDGSLLRRVQRIALGPTRRVNLVPAWFAGAVTTLLVVSLVGLSRAPALAGTLEPVITLPALTVRPNSVQHAEPPDSTTTARTTMNARSLLAATAAVTLAAANLSAQTVPDFSGRWIAVGDTSREELTIRQTDQTLTLGTVAAGEEASLTYSIADAGRRSIKLTGPVAMRVKIRGVTFSLDGIAGAPRISAEWQDKTRDGRVSFQSTDIDMATMTLTLDESGEMIVEIEMRPQDGKPGRWLTSRMRRM